MEDTLYLTSTTSCTSWVSPRKWTIVIQQNAEKTTEYAVPNMNASANYSRVNAIRDLVN